MKQKDRLISQKINFIKREEVISLREQLRDKFSFKNIIGRSDKMKEVLYKIEKVALTNTTVDLLSF